MMKFYFAESMCDPSQLLPIAQAADDAGYDGFYVPDSIIYPKEAVGQYPYTETGDREFLETVPFIDPFTLVAAMGAITERIRFATFVIKLPIREPVLVAKQAASVSALTGDRFDLGVGLSPWVEDFEVTNQDWKSRGPRMNEMIEIIRGLCSTAPPDYYSFKGEHYDIPEIRINPIPSEPLKILIGGTSVPALKRAARLGDGWMYAGFDPAHLDDCLEKLAGFRKEFGRENDPFEIHAPPVGATGLDDFKRFEEKGVTHCGLGVRNGYEPDRMTLQQKLDGLRGLADGLVSKLRE
jgi:alkanesulfonate monooxygenase SsuD/methylene tetrahydromethanopterin reductase-like flavin-dependent oxidoreductase (luciferase family)